MRIGFHVSIAGGFSRALRRAVDLGCNCLQLFSSNPRSWVVKPLDLRDLAEFKRLREEWDMGPIFVHTNYLINLASPRTDLFEKSIERFVVDLNRTEQLGAEYLVTHLGSADARPARWISGRLSEALNRIINLHPPQAMILLENAAGEKGEAGYELEQIEAVISRLNNSSGVGICYDTCHGFAAGYDMRTEKDVDALARRIDAAVGIGRLKGMHLNDCLRDMGSRIDRHWHIGEGKIGREGFRAVLNHPLFEAIPKVMETPKKSKEDDPRNMRIVKSLLRTANKDRVLP